MKRSLPVLLAFLTLVCVTPTLQQCFTWYRHDTLEKWAVPVSSRLCKLNVTNLTMEQDKYLLSSENGIMMLRAKDYSASIGDNWISEKDIPFSISVYRNNLYDPHFFTIQTTEDQKQQGTYQHSVTNGIKGHSRSTYFVSPQEISSTGSNLRFWMLIILYVIFGLLAALGIFASVMNFGNAFAFFLILGLSCITAWVKFTDITWFMVTLGILWFLSVLFGVANYLWGRSFASIFFGFLLVVYYFFGGSPENRYAFGPAVSLLALITLFFTWKLERITAVQKVKFFMLMLTFWTIQYQFWSSIWNIYPTELYFRVFKGPLDYHVGTQGSGIRLYVPSFFALLGAAFCLFLSGLLADKRTKLGNYAIDSNQKETMPLI